METRRFKRCKSNRRLQLVTLLVNRVPAQSDDSESQGQERSRLPVNFFPLLLCARAGFSAALTTDSGGGFKGAWTNVWPQDQLHSRYTFRVWNLDSSVKKLCPCKQAEN